MINANFDVSVVVPVYAGKAYLEKLANAVFSVRREWFEKSYPMRISELIFVDDGSSDGSADILSQLETRDWIKVVTLSRNYGQHPATVAGISYSTGDWIFTIDEDFQHKPELFFDMLKECIKNSSDILYAKPKGWVHKSAFRDFSSRSAKWVIAHLAKNPNIRNFNSFRLIRGNIARTAAAVSGYESFFDIVLGWHSTRVAVLETYMEDERYTHEGDSGYNFRKLLSHSRKMIMTSDARVLRKFGLVALILVTLLIFFAILILIQKVLFPTSIAIQGWVSLMLLIIATGCIISAILSVISEYLANVVQHINGKPSFSIVDRARDKELREFFFGDTKISGGRDI